MNVPLERWPARSMKILAFPGSCIRRVRFRAGAEPRNATQSRPSIEEMSPRGHGNLARLACVLCCASFFFSQAIEGAAQELYPKPLVHTATDHPAARVILISVDGLGALDLAAWISAHPRSALAELSARGDTFTNAHTPEADPAGGLAALITGGTSISTGILSSDGYDRTLSPPGSKCLTRGAALVLDRSMEVDGSKEQRLDSSKLPLDPARGCIALEPHSLLSVNNIFEVIHAQVGRTAWAGENVALTDLARGPSGAGLDDACNFPSEPNPGSNGRLAEQEADRQRVEALLRWLDGQDCTGKPAPVPALSGISFISLATTSRAAEDNGNSGVIDDASSRRTASLQFIDDSLTSVVAKLKEKHLFASTWIVVTAPFSSAPGIPPKHFRTVPLAEIAATVNSVKPGLTAHIGGGNDAMIWLSTPSLTGAATEALARRSAELGIGEIVTGPELALTGNSPSTDPRVPDILLRAQPEIVWNPATYGGNRNEGTHVAMLVSGAQLGGRLDKTWVPTTQLAPLLLRAFGLEKFDLQALHKEHSPALPGIF